MHQRDQKWLNEGMGLEHQYFAFMGLMGVGKSTGVDLVRRRLSRPVVQEDFSGNPYLDGFYKNPKEFAYPSQLFFLDAKANGLIEHSQKNSPISLVDTPIEQDVYCYAQAQHILGNFTGQQWQDYQARFHELQKVIPATTAIIYLTAPFDIIVKRIEERGRESEKNISRDYLSLLLDLNERFISSTEIPHIAIDTTHLDLIGSAEDKKFLVSVVKTYINTRSRNPI